MRHQGISANGVSSLLRLPPASESRRGEISQAVANAYTRIEGFAALHGWSDRMGVFFTNGVEVHETQSELWARIIDLYGMPATTPLPTPGLAGALERGILLVVTPEEYARVAPDYGTVPGAHERLMAHEMAHRLHVSILDGDEDAMGPEWFYEGFAIVASGDLAGSSPADSFTWAALTDRGPGAYRRYGILLRRLMDAVPLPRLVERARYPGFDVWAQDLLASLNG